MSGWYQNNDIEQALRIRVALLLVVALVGNANAAPIRALIVDGRNNHDWQITTDALRATLEASKRFEVSVSTAPE